MCPAVFIGGAFLQFWIFRLFHKFGHPWSRIIYPENDSTKNRKQKAKAEESAKFFGQFWQQVEKESESKLKRYNAARIGSKDVPVQINESYIHVWNQSGLPELCCRRAIVSTSEYESCGSL